MKVIHVSCVAPPQVGGIGRVASQEVAGLKSRGIKAELARIPSIWRYGNTAIPNPFALDRLLRGADIVHLHYPFYGTVEFVTFLRKIGRIKKLVMTLHMDAQAPGIHGAIFNFHRFFFQPFELAAADALIVSSRDYAEHSSFAPFASRAIELPFGVDETMFEARSLEREARRDRQLPDSRFQILFVGGMDRAHAFKGIPVLLDAMKRLGDARVAPTLMLVGDGDLRPAYEKRAHELGISSRVTFLGRVDDAALPDLFRRADVFAFPSTSGAEAFGLAALEAQACGVPVVASDLPGVRTVVANGETGFLARPDDDGDLAAHIQTLFDDEPLRRTMGERARQRVLEKFTRAKHLDGLIDVYHKVCASRS